MDQYLDLLNDVKRKGVLKGDRTGTGTRSVFGRQIRFDLSYGFPLVTTKKVHLKSVIVELLWFLQGKTNTKFLTDNGCKIWNEWALTEEMLDKSSSKKLESVQRYNRYLDTLDSVESKREARKTFNSDGGLSETEGNKIFDAAGIPEFFTYRELGFRAGDLGPVYGKQWRSWVCPNRDTIDQISEVINLLKTKPDSRRLIVSAWNPADLPDESISPQENVLNGKMTLAACHTMFQFYSCEIPSAGKYEWLYDNDLAAYNNLLGDNDSVEYSDEDLEKVEAYFIENNLPQRYLSCQLYQRSVMSA